VAEELCEIVAAAGYSAVSTTSGPRGLMLALEHIPSVIVSDMNLADLKGASLLRLLKQNPATEAIPVVGTLERAEQFTPGTAASLPKPIQAEHLVATLKRLAARVWPAGPDTNIWRRTR